jgi:hypothetical protein
MLTKKLFSIFLVIFCAGYTISLLVVPMSVTRHQLICGIGIPLSGINEAVTLGWTIKVQYSIPESVSFIMSLDIQLI